MQKAVCLAGASLLLAACASQPEDIQPSYVSPVQYQSYNCNQVELELQRVSARVAEVTDQQQAEADGDAVATGVGIVLFWPALFFLMGDDQEEQLARLKGEYEALERAAIQKECAVAADLQEARERREEKRREREKKEEQERRDKGPRMHET